MSEKEYRTMRIRLFPDPEQRKQIMKDIEGYNFVYNSILEKQKVKENRLYGFDLTNYATELKEEHEFLKDCSSKTLQGAGYDLKLEYDTHGYNIDMKPKNSTEYSFYPDKSSYGEGSDSVNVVWENNLNGYVKLPKLGKVKFINCPKFKYNRKIKKCTIKLINNAFHLILAIER